MKPFSTIAIPHKDIIEGKFTKDTFAANLWEVYKGRAPEEYTDSDIFFKRTYLTEGISALINTIEKRLKGEDTEAIIQLQTPFGGGKTHSLIAVYHKAKTLGAKVVVLDGYALNPSKILLWQELEKQITGKIERFKGNTPPAGEELREFFSKHQPLLILMDEILDYTISASSVKINNLNLSTYVLNFIRYLADAIRTLNKTALVITYPSKSHYDEHGQRIYELLYLRTGRVTTPYPPVKDEEIYDVITTRLFKSIDRKTAREVIEEFLDYAENEKLFLEGEDKSTYRQKFSKSFPFQPEVIDVLYKRWGSFPRFERTRGVLFLLASVVYKLKDSYIPFIRLSDFDLKDSRIKSILVDVIGPQWNSIISEDITSEDSAAKKVDKELPSTYLPYSLGTRVATTIFLYSFSGGPERGATTAEIKLSSAALSVPSAIIVDTIDKLTSPLRSLYLDHKEGRYFYTTEIALPRILINKMQSIEEDEVRTEEKEALVKTISKEHFDIFIWPKSSKDIPDTKRLKLIILQSQEVEKCKEFLENHGGRPRVYRNTLIFICPMDSERAKFEEFVRRKLAWQLIEKDKTLKLTSEQKKEVKDNIRKAEVEVKESVRSLYRIVLIPSKDGFKDVDLGLPTYGADIVIDKEIYERLKSEGEILEKLSPLSLKEKYLKDRDWVETKNILESFFKTAGEIRIISDEVLRDCIKEGVKKGLFGIGEIEDGSPVCRYFKTEILPALVEEEILIKAELCEKPEEKISDEGFQSYITKIHQSKTIEDIGKIREEIAKYTLSSEQKEKLENHIRKKEEELRSIHPPLPGEKYQKISLILRVPTGKLSDIARMIPYFKTKFSQLDIKVEISAQDGEIEISDYEDKIKEAINQAGVTIEKEEVE